MIKRIALCLLIALAGMALMIGVEILVAMRREYLPTEPALDIGGTIGSKGDPVTLVVLGDSTGAGVGAGRAERSYPYVLAQRLADVRGIAIELVDLAESGARVGTVLAEQVNPALEADPDVVVVAIGANDVTHLTNLDSLRDDLDRMLRRLKDRGAPVIVAGAPDMRAPAFLEPLRSIAGWRGRAVTAAIEETAEEANVTVVPLAERTRDFFLTHPDEAYSSDLFHPGPAGYERWADAFFPEVLRAIDSLPR